MMQLEIKVFGKLTEIIGGTCIINNCIDTNTLSKYLAEQYPTLLNIKYAIAIDKQIITSNTSINEGSIIALLPPFSGG